MATNNILGINSSDEQVRANTLLNISKNFQPTSAGGAIIGGILQGLGLSEKQEADLKQAERIRGLQEQALYQQQVSNWLKEEEVRSKKLANFEVEKKKNTSILDGLTNRVMGATSQEQATAMLRSGVKDMPSGFIDSISAMLPEGESFDTTRLSVGEGKTLLYQTMDGGIESLGKVSDLLSQEGKMELAKLREAEASATKAEFGAQTPVERARQISEEAQEVGFTERQAELAGLAELGVKAESTTEDILSDKASEKIKVAVEETLSSVNKTKDTIGVIKDKIQANPDIVGVRGTLAKLGEGVTSGFIPALGDAIGEVTGIDVNEVFAQATTQEGLNVENAIASKVQAGEAASLASLEVMLAYQLAKANDPAGRVSDADLRASMKSIGLTGTFDTPNTAIARLDTVMQLLDKEAERAKQRFSDPTQPFREEAQPTTGKVLTFDPATGTFK